MKITNITGHEIYDSRGLPTIACRIEMENNVAVLSSVPSGVSKGMYEAVELRDGGTRLMGYGVSNAIRNLETVIAPELIGKVPDIVEMDLKMIEMDGTENKAKLGANAILAASIAIAKAQAVTFSVEPYELLAQVCGFDSVTLPFPMFNMINGGAHADNNLNIQEIMLVPLGAQDFRSAMEAAVTTFYELKILLKEQGKSTLVGDEGGFAPNFIDEYEALDLLMEAMQRAGYDEIFSIALDVAASQLYDQRTQKYHWHGTLLSTQELIEKYSKLAEQYPIYSIEDGLSENDWTGWVAMMGQLGDKLQLVGDDLFVTNMTRISEGIHELAANAAIIKPNQIGTITETLQAIILCKEHGMNTIVSHRAGETEDTFIVDLAVGTSSGQLKAGGCSRGERVTKYNRLLRIEDLLHFSLLRM